MWISSKLFHIYITGIDVVDFINNDFYLKLVDS